MGDVEEVPIRCGRISLAAYIRLLCRKREVYIGKETYTCDERDVDMGDECL